MKTTKTLCLGPIPDHLTRYEWYAPHQAFLRAHGQPHHDPGNTEPLRANLTGVNLSETVLAHANLRDAVLIGAKLTWADLTGVDLTGANLGEAVLAHANLRDADLTRAKLAHANMTDADLYGADLTDADLYGAVLPSPDEPQTLAEAIQRLREWLTEDRWIQGEWIQTPDGCYSGTCRACLHGAAIYVGGSFGRQICDQLDTSEYTIHWNDEVGRTHADVVAAIDAISE